MTVHSPQMFLLEPSLGTPIYRQIIEQVNRLVLSGFLKAGDELPSVRHTATTLEVNPMTISKAYSFLEASGMLERVRGRGMVVARDKTSKESLKRRLEKLRPVLTETAKQANQLAVPREKILKFLSDILEDSNER